MNISKILPKAGGLFAGLLLISGVAQAAPSSDWPNWLARYYENPQPFRIVSAVHELSESGALDAPGQVPVAIGFFAQVFASNPEQVASWVPAFRDLPVRHQRLMAAALWYSGLPDGVDHLRALAADSSPEIRAEVENLMTWAQPSLRDTPVQSQSSLNLQWGAFLASGDAKHIVNVLAALGSEVPSLGSAARLALAEKAVTHQRVYDICQREIARQPEGVREQMSTALWEARQQR